MRFFPGVQRIGVLSTNSGNGTVLSMFVRGKDHLICPMWENHGCFLGFLKWSGLANIGCHAGTTMRFKKLQKRWA